MVTRRCSAYGLSCATNFDWPWCHEASSDRAPDVTLALGELGRYGRQPEDQYQLLAERRSNDRERRVMVRVERSLDDQHLRIRYADGAEFVIDAAASQVFGISRSELSLADLLVYLQAPVLGFLLRLRGVTCLHAAAVELD